MWNVFAFGAKPNGATDDTAALQSLLDRFSSRGQGCKSGRIFFPSGTYVITRTLVYSGNVSCSLEISGEQTAARGGSGSQIEWRGPAGAPMLLLMNANQTKIDNLDFNTGKTAGYGIYAASGSAYSGTITQRVSPGMQTASVSSTRGLAPGTWLPVDSGPNYEVVRVTSVGPKTFTAAFSKSHAAGTHFGGGISSGIFLRNDAVISLSGASSVGVAFGNPNRLSTPQISEDWVYDSRFSGDGTALAGIEQVSTGNTKNLFIRDCTFSALRYGIRLGDSGSEDVDGSVFAGIRVADVYGGGFLQVSNSESEDAAGASFVAVVGTSSENRRLTLINNSWETQPPARGYVVAWNGTLTLVDNRFGITGNGAAAKIEDDSHGPIVSIGNTYINAPVPGYAPIYFGNVRKTSGFLSYGDYGRRGAVDPAANALTNVIMDRTEGVGAPRNPCQTGSIYTRTDGGPGSTLYVCEGGKWAAK